MESSGGTGHAVQFAPRREETMWQHFLVVSRSQVNNRRFTVSATQSSRVVEKPHKIHPTGGRKILLDFVVEKSQKFDAGTVPFKPPPRIIGD